MRSQGGRYHREWRLFALSYAAGLGFFLTYLS